MNHEWNAGLHASTLAPAMAMAIAAGLVATAMPARRAIAAPPAADADTLDRIDVKGRRAGATDDLDAARRRLDERAGAASVIDGERYRDGRVSTLADALGHAPGVFVQPRFGAEEARLSIRGSGLQRTFHGRGIQLMQDGSPLNLADGGFDFQAIEPLSTRYIEVHRGANALEHGSATLGGAIDFVSPTGLDAPRATLRGESGSFGYRRAQAALAGSRGRGDAYLGITRFAQAGFRDHARQDTRRLFANAGVRFDDALAGRVHLTHVDTRSALPGSLTFAEAADDPAQAAPGNLALDQRRDFRLDRIAATLRWSVDDARELRVSGYFSGKSLDHPIFQVLRQESRDYGLGVRFRHEGRLGGHRNVFIAGATAARGDTDDDRFANIAGDPGARANAFRQRARNTSAYAENQTWLTDRLVLALGAQALRATRASRDRFVTGGRDESFDAGYSGFSPKLGLRWLPGDPRSGGRTQVFANISRSFEPPSFGELSGGPGVTRVDAQTATSAEIGLRVDRETLSIDAALYRARIDGELLALADGAGNPLGTLNAGRTIHQGVEFGMDWRFRERFAWSANYLWNDFRFDGDRGFGDNRLAGVPEHQLRTQLRWSKGERFYVAPNLEWAPRDAFIDHANTLSAPGYALVGLKVGGTFGSGDAGAWSWFVDGRNLADRRWIAGTGVVADALGRDGRYLLPGDGRAVYAGIQWRMP